ncbi:MAG: hypothetical protein GEU73_11515 [Chloroflexi bacterium]|nr:hypothetical protein [Chloroflexota bacterium]
MTVLLRHRLLPGALASVVLASIACLGQSPTSPTGSASSASQERSAAQGSNGPKILTWAALRELASFEAVIGLGGSGSPAGEVTPVVHDFLVVENDRFDVVPRLAVERPSVENGTWRVDPDGSMVTTWRIRPNITWHDGQPFTSADVAFMPLYYVVRPVLVLGSVRGEVTAFETGWNIFAWDKEA